MTRYEIIRIAREAGLPVEAANVGEGIMCGMVPPHGLERFAAIVAAAEREACAKVADEWQTAIHDPRYECDCAAAIRARGEVK